MATQELHLPLELSEASSVPQGAGAAGCGRDREWPTQELGFQGGITCTLRGEGRVTTPGGQACRDLGKRRKGHPHPTLYKN